VCDDKRIQIQIKKGGNEKMKQNKIKIGKQEKKKTFFIVYVYGKN